jgi:hypothetical protein
MRRAAKVDGNHGDVVAALRKVGIAARSTATIGEGFPDLLAGFRGVNVLLEIKDSTKPPSARKLTKAEEDFIATWPGPVYVVTSAEEAVRVVVETARPGRFDERGGEEAESDCGGGPVVRGHG